MKNKGYFTPNKELSHYMFQFQPLDLRTWLMLMEDEKKCQETMDLQYENGDAIGWALTEALCFAFEKWTLEEFNSEMKRWLESEINPC